MDNLKKMLLTQHPFLFYVKSPRLQVVGSFYWILDPVNLRSKCFPFRFQNYNLGDWYLGFEDRGLFYREFNLIGSDRYKKSIMFPYAGSIYANFYP